MTSITAIDGELRKEDIGSIIEITVKENGAPLNIGAASIKQIILKKPSGAVLAKPAEFATDGTDGRLRYVTVEGDLSEAGVWQAQAKVVLPTGTWKTDIARIRVYDNL